MPANTSQIASLRRSVGLEKYLEILESHAFHLDVFCSVCCSGFKVSKISHASEHVKTAWHEKGIELSKPNQQQLRLHPTKKATGENIEGPSEMAIYAFAPAISIDVERFFSVLKAFLEDRPCILEKTVDKLMFVRYNQHI